MLEAAASTFEIKPSVDSFGLGQDVGKVEKVYSGLKTTVLLLRDNGLTLCLIASHITAHTRRLNDLIRKQTAAALGIPADNVLFFSVHNHCAVHPNNEETLYWWHGEKRSPGKNLLNDTGNKLLNGIVDGAKKLLGSLVPVSVWYACGKEGRISYNRKGRHDDGSAYFMREEDRLLLGKDFRGEIEEDAPVVALKDEKGNLVSFIVQFSAHPVTGYHPEHPIVFGEYPQVAADTLSAHFSKKGKPVPVAFLQGCAGNMNTKGFMTGNVELSRKYGTMLGQTFIRACRKLKKSQSDTLGFSTAKSGLPFSRLPSEKALVKEMDEMADFIRRVEAGDEESTLICLGQNFPRKALTPAYRVVLVKAFRPWTVWALKTVRAGKTDALPRFLETQVYAVRIGDVGIVGLEGEPFTGIGRQIKAGSPFPLTIPCGYVNVSHGYVPDGPNVGDQDYFSSFYRFTRYRPPYRKPGGDVWAQTGVRLLKQLGRRK